FPGDLALRNASRSNAADQLERIVPLAADQVFHVVEDHEAWHAAALQSAAIQTIDLPSEVHRRAGSDFQGVLADPADEGHAVRLQHFAQAGQERQAEAAGDSGVIIVIGVGGWRADDDL